MSESILMRTVTLMFTDVQGSIQWKTLDVIPNNLPVPLMRCVGRGEALKALRKLLVEGDTRLITLTGSGGMGKTRLALQVGAELLSHFPDGAVQALVWRATYGWKQGDYAEAQRLFEQGLGIARGGEDREGVASCLYGLGNIAAAQGEYAEAQKLHAESLGIRKGLGNRCRG